MKPDVIKVGVGRDAGVASDIVEYILKVDRISKRFGGVTALDDCSISVRAGKLVAIIGPNGSGKSTLFHIISGLVKQDQGKMMFKDHDISSLKDFKRAKLGISRTFQEVRLFRNLTIREHLELAMNKKSEKMLTSMFRSEQPAEEDLVKTLNLVNLYKPMNTIATELSYGQRKLLDLAVAIAKPHDMLMLDEPVAGINPKFRKDIKDVLKQLKENKETILLIEHDMNFVMDLADVIYVLDNGKVIAEGTPEDIQKNDKVLEAYLGG